MDQIQRALARLGVGVRTVLRMRPSRVVRRIVYLSKVQVLSRFDVANAIGFRECNAPRQVHAPAMAAEILMWREASFSADQHAVEVGELALRGTQCNAGPLDLLDWSSLGRGEPETVNRDYELAYCGFAVSPSVRAGPEYFDYLARVLIAVESIGGAKHWRSSLTWKPISVSCRLINLIAVLHFGRVSGALKPQAQKVISHHAALCAQFLETFREDYLGYNHLAFNMVSVLCWRAALGEMASPAFERELVRILDEQILADGDHAERTPGYHVHVLSLIRLAVLARALSPHGQAAIEDFARRMTSALAVWVHPDGDVAVFNDTSLGDAPPARLFLSPEQIHPVASVLVLSSTGAAKIASSENAVLIDAGPQMNWACPGHGHAGYLTCEVSWRGRRFVIDPGVASYSTGQKRDWTRSSRSHNGPYVCGGEPLEFGGAFEVGRYSVGRVKELEGFGENDAVVASYRPYFSKSAILRIAAQDRQTGSILIADAWEEPKAACAGDFLISSIWRLEDTQVENEVAFSCVDGRANFRVLAGSLSLCAPNGAYPFGPAAGNVVQRLKVSPTLLGCMSVRAIVIGAPTSMMNSEFVNSNLLNTTLLQRLLDDLRVSG